MFSCRKTQIDTIRSNLSLFIYLMPQEVEYTLASEYVKINEALYDWYVLATSNNIFLMDTQLVEKA